MQAGSQAQLVRALNEAMAPPESGIRVIDGGAIELPVQQAGIRLYLVQSAPPAERSSGPATALPAN